MADVALWGSEPHYRRHLAPIAQALGLEVTTRPTAAALSIVAGYKDLYRITGPAALVEHGAGQTYSVAHPAYAGGKRREQVRLFICPSERVAEANRAAYPNATAVAVGCPALDGWHRSPPTGSVVAVSFHWNASVCPESRSAWQHYWRGLRDLASRFEVIGHGHPRIFEHLRHQYDRLGIEPVREFDEVMERAAVYVCDNSSTIYEFASTDRPVVVMNAPWYRRHVEHGLRFWAMADVGEQVDGPEGVPGAVERALEHDPQATRRREIVREVYAYTDGTATQRAAAAIRNTNGGGA